VTGVIAAIVGVYATTRDDKIGDVARGAGAMTVVAYDKAKEADQKYSITEKIMVAGTATIAKAKQIDEEYKIVEKTKAAGVATINKAKELDDEYKISERTKAAASQLAAQAKEINEKYELTDKASKLVNTGLSKALSFVGSMSTPRAPASAQAVTSNESIPVAEARVLK